MSNLNQFIFFVIFSIPSLGFSNFNYEIDSNDSGDSLIVTDQVNGEKFKGPSGYRVSIRSVDDFYNDGSDDAYVSISEGGNCCPNDNKIISIKNGSMITTDFDIGWSDLEVVKDNGRTLFYSKNTDSTKIFSYKNNSLELVKKLDKLKAISEVYGTGKTFSDDSGLVVLSYDINGDQKIDEIECTIWGRWGNINCTLPLPQNGEQRLSIGCDRFGVLDEVSNGYHKFVCNNDTVVTFNGKKWVW